MIQRQSLYFTAPFQTEIRTETLPPLQADQLLVEAHYSAISAGSEMLLFRGEMEHGSATDTTIAALAGTMQYPLKYGYACVGQVVKVGRNVSSQWRDQIVFAFNPHETHFITTPENVHVVPAGVSPQMATLLPNIETATSFVMDGRPLIGERVTVFGQGIVGLLTTFLLAKFPLASLTTVDLHPLRRDFSLRLGASQATTLDALAQGESDLAYELTGRPEVIADAINRVGYNGRVVVGSWYGNKSASIALGDHFHRNRVQLISSQVSTLDPRWRGRWTKSRRLDVAWTQLQAVPPEIITNKVLFAQVQAAYERSAEAPENSIQTIIDYRS